MVSLLLIDLLWKIKSFGINNILLLLGYKADIIENHLKDGSSFGVNLSYNITPVEYDTADRLVDAKDFLDNKFLFMYCDNYCPINFNKLNEISIKNNAYVTLTVYENKDKWTKSNVIVDANNKVIVYDKKRQKNNLSGVDIGYAIIKKDILDYLLCKINDININHNSYGSLTKVYEQLVIDNRLFAYQTEHRYYSIGSYDRSEYTKKFFYPKKAVFLDRDGTINIKAEKACYIEKVVDFVWINNAKEAIKLLNDNDYIVVLVTNQPGIARKKITYNDLNMIYKKKIWWFI